MNLDELEREAIRLDTERRQVEQWAKIIDGARLYLSSQIKYEIWLKKELESQVDWSPEDRTLWLSEKEKHYSEYLKSEEERHNRWISSEHWYKSYKKVKNIKNSLGQWIEYHIEGEVS